MRYRMLIATFLLVAVTGLTHGAVKPVSERCAHHQRQLDYYKRLLESRKGTPEQRERWLQLRKQAEQQFFRCARASD